MQNTIRLRSRIAMATRTYLDTMHGNHDRHYVKVFPIFSQVLWILKHPHCLKEHQKYNKIKVLVICLSLYCHVQGAREFIVPTRTPGQFYSLTQSPQQVMILALCCHLSVYLNCYNKIYTEFQGPDNLLIL